MLVKIYLSILGVNIAMASKIKCMKDLVIFESLNGEEKNQVTKIAQAKSYNKGDTIFLEGETADTVYLVRAGRVLLYKISEEGKEITLDILQVDDIFGENTLFDDILHTMNAKAIEDTFVCTCSRNDLPHLLQNPMIALKIIKVLGEKLNNYTEQMANLAFRDVKGRVLNILVRLAKEYGQTTSTGIMIDVTLNHQDMASLVNASRVMVTNTLNDLKHEGKIAVREKRFYIIDQELLKEADFNA